MVERPTEPPAAALRIALERYMRRQLPDKELRRVLHTWVWQTKATGLRAEEVIIRFNTIWRSIPDVRRAPPVRRRLLRERLVSTCIADYYQDVD